MSEHFSKIPAFGPERIYVAPGEDGTVSVDTTIGALKVERWSTNRVRVDHHLPEVVDVTAFASRGDEFVSVSVTTNLMRDEGEPSSETNIMLTQEQAVALAHTILAKVEAKQEQEVPA